jgi:hypothetical protein
VTDLIGPKDGELAFTKYKFSKRLGLLELRKEGGSGEGLFRQ